MNNIITIYLVNDNYGWQKEAMSNLYKASRYRDLKICVINPSAFEFPKKEPRLMKKYCFNRLMQCDIVLACLNHSATSPMIAQQIQYAVDACIPVIGYGTIEIDRWISEVDCEAVFDNIMEATEYVDTHYIKACLPLESRV